MLETATVIKINKDIATLVCGANAGCQSCAAHGFCGGAGEKNFEALNVNNIELEPGNSVEVLLPTGKTIGSAFMVMIFPLLLFVLFFYLAGFIIENASEGVQVLGGLVGIAVGFGFNFLKNRTPNKKNMPKIVRKLV